MIKIIKYIHLAITLITAALGTIALIAAFMGQTHCLLTAAMLGALTWVGIKSIKEDVAGEQSDSVRQGV